RRWRRDRPSLWERRKPRSGKSSPPWRLPLVAALAPLLHRGAGLADGNRRVARSRCCHAFRAATRAVRPRRGGRAGIGRRRLPAAAVAAGRLAVRGLAAGGAAGLGDALARAPARSLAVRGGAGRAARGVRARRAP